MAAEGYLSKLRELFGNRTFEFNLNDDVPESVVEWIRNNPWQTAFIIANGVIVFNPGAVTIPVLLSIGFGPQGPVLGKCTHSICSYYSVRHRFTL